MNPLSFSIDPQECSEWCWAAVTAAVGRFYQDANCPRQQCQLVNQVLELPKDCCTDGNCQNDPSEPCNQPENLGFVLDTFHHGRDGTSGVASLEFSDIQSEINNEHPVVVSITLDDPAASGHAIVIFGYTDDGKVHVADPMQAGTGITVSFNDLRAGTASELHGKWQAAFRTKKVDE